MSDAASLDSIATASLDSHFDQLEDRLVGDYGTSRRATVHALVDEERARFANARVHAFVPILVERSVRSRLEQPAR